MRNPAFHGLRLDAAHWRGRALEARALAEQIPDPKVQQQMLKVAASYDKLADRGETASRTAELDEAGRAMSAPERRG